MAPTKRPADKAGKAFTKAPTAVGDAVDITPFLEDDVSVVTTPESQQASAAHSTKKRKRGEERPWPWTHEVPTADDITNVISASGRRLVPWQRPRMAEKLLMCIEYECARQGIRLPWKDIAHRFNPGTSGDGVTQHLGRLRAIMAAEGHLIPPDLPKRGDPKPVHSSVRGYVRTGLGEDNVIKLREVKFTERHEHRKTNLPDAPEISVYHHRRKTRTPLIYLNRSASNDENDGYDGDEEDGQLPCVDPTLQYGDEDDESEQGNNSYDDPLVAAPVGSSSESTIVSNGMRMTMAEFNLHNRYYQWAHGHPHPEHVRIFGPSGNAQPETPPAMPQSDNSMPQPERYAQPSRDYGSGLGNPHLTGPRQQVSGSGNSMARNSGYAMPGLPGFIPGTSDNGYSNDPNFRPASSLRFAGGSTATNSTVQGNTYSNPNSSYYVAVNPQTSATRSLWDYTPSASHAGVSGLAYMPSHASTSVHSQSAAPEQAQPMNTFTAINEVDGYTVVNKDDEYPSFDMVSGVESDEDD